MAELDQLVVASIRKLTTEVERLGKSTEKANAPAERLAHQYRRLGEERGPAEQNRALDGMTGRLAGLAAGVLSIRQAWQLAAGAVREHYEQLSRTNAEIGRVIQLAQGLAAGGGLTRFGAQFAGDARAIAAKGVVGSEGLLRAAQRYKGVSKDASPEDIRAFMLAAQAAGTSGEQDLGTFAGLYGTLHEAGMGHAESGDLAKLTQEQLGEDASAAMLMVRAAVGRYGPQAAPQLLALLTAQARFGSRGLRSGGTELMEWAQQGGRIEDFVHMQLAQDPALASRYQELSPQFAGYQGHLRGVVGEAVSSQNPQWAAHVETSRLEHQRERVAAARAPEAAASSYADAVVALDTEEDRLMHPGWVSSVMRAIWYNESGRRAAARSAAEVGMVEEAGQRSAGDLVRTLDRLTTAIDRLAAESRQGTLHKGAD
jgi:hypothetical protein